MYVGLEGILFGRRSGGQPSGQPLTYDFCMITEEGRQDFRRLRLPVPSTVHIYLSKDLLVFALIPITELIRLSVPWCGAFNTLS
jgi:hypothetical protein